MKILGNRVLVSKIEEDKKEGFQTVEVQDSFVYKGKVEMSNNVENIPIGSTIIFAKYSPDTHEVEHEGRMYKSVMVSDIIAVL